MADSMISKQRFPRKRTLFALLALAFAGLALAPTVISHTRLRDLVLRVILPVRGTATAEQGSLGWFSPIWLGGAVVRDEAGQPVLEADELSLGRTLLQLAWNPKDLGPLALTNPRLKVRMEDGTVDVARVFGPLFEAKPDEKASLTGFEIVNGTVDFIDPGQGIELQVIALTVSIDSSRPAERVIFQVAGDLTVLKPDSAGLYQPPIALAGGGRYEVAADELALSGLKIAPLAGPFSCRADGRIAQLSTRPMLELSGQFEYDLPQLADRLRPYVGGDLQLAGRDVRPFKIAGPLADAYEEGDTPPQVTRVVGWASPTSRTGSTPLLSWKRPFHAVSREQNGTSIGQSTFSSTSLVGGAHPTTRVAWQGQVPPPEPTAEAAAEEAKKKKKKKKKGGDPYSWLKKLGAEADLAWKSASGFGVEIGEATLKGQLLKGWLDLASTPIDVADGKIDLKTRLNLATSTPELTIGPGRVADHVRLTPKVCAQGLRFIAPVLANATEVEGRFSLDVDECRIPLTPGRQPVVKGALSIHNVDVTATGPLVKQIAEIMRVDSRARLVRESVVEFEMIGNRVHHKGLEFQLAGIRVLTHGSVGLDESLDLVAEFPIPEAWLGPGLVGQQLRGQAIRLPVGGTLRKPQVDVKALAHMNVGILGDTGEALRGVIDGDPILPAGVSELLEGLLERRKARLQKPGQPEPSTPLLDLIRDRRKQRALKPPVPSPVPSGPREF